MKLYPIYGQGGRLSGLPVYFWFSLDIIFVKIPVILAKTHEKTWKVLVFPMDTCYNDYR